MHFQNDVRHNIGIEEILKEDNLITSKVDNYRMWAIRFCVKIK